MQRMYFIGVTTGASSIHQIFPSWMKLAGVSGAELTGLDIPVGSPAAAYRGAIQRIADDTQARGGLITTHKVNVYRHTAGMFAAFDDDARMLGEVSCVQKQDGQLFGKAVDPAACGDALRVIFGERRFNGQALIMGAGGAGVALAVQLLRDHSPPRLMLTDVSEDRLAEAARLVPCETRLVDGIHDSLIADMAAGALIVNATGLGKDRAGSPVTPGVRFPPDGIAWDLNYRGDLRWLDWARMQGVRIVDGWDCFLFGWSRITSLVFGFELTADLFQKMRAAASNIHNP
jgi:shikimate 5-dehydrogenase